MADTSAQGKLVLVVDDDAMILRLVSSTLAHAGYRVEVAENGAAGLEAFRSIADEVELVLTDFVMPVMNGAEMAHQIQAEKPETRVVFMTAYAEELLNAGAPVVRKPFLPDDLLRVVEKTFGGR